MDRLAVGREYVVEVLHAFGRHVQNDRPRPQTCRHLGGVYPYDPAPDDEDLSRVNTGNAAGQKPEAPVGVGQVVGSHQHRHPPRHLAHGHEQRQAHVGELHRLVGDAHDAALQQHVGQIAVGSQMKIGEEHQIVPEVLVLRRQGLLDLDHHVGPCPDFGSIVHQFGALGGVVLVREGAAHPCRAFDEDLVPGLGECPGAGRRDADPVLVVLDLPRAPNDHLRTSPV